MPSYCKHCKRLGHDITYCKILAPTAPKVHAQHEKKSYRPKAHAAPTEKATKPTSSQHDPTKAVPPQQDPLTSAQDTTTQKENNVAPSSKGLEQSEPQQPQQDVQQHFEEEEEVYIEALDTQPYEVPPETHQTTMSFQICIRMTLLCNHVALKVELSRLDIQNLMRSSSFLIYLKSSKSKYT